MHKVKDGCPGCGACLGICPVDALVSNGVSVTIAETCVDCGICVPTCPVGLIEKAVTEQQQAGESNFPKDEQEGGA